LRKACREHERQSPQLKAQKRCGNKAINSTANYPPCQKGAAIIKIPSVDKFYVHALTLCGDIAAPEINGDSSLISRPVRGDLIPQYLGQECRTLEVHITDNWIIIWGRCFVGLVDGLIWGHWFVSFRPSLRSGRAVKEQRLRRLWLSLFDGGRGNNYTDAERAWTVVLSTLDAFIAAPFLGAEVCFALIVRFAFWFLALVIEGLRPSNSSQAFREKLDQKLYSLAYLFQYSCVIFLRIFTWGIPSSRNSSEQTSNPSLA